MMMNGGALAALAIGDASLRYLSTEMEGPRPGGMPGDAVERARREPKTSRATRP